ncbi:MAG: type II toxin-antitoxin system RelE/ParE family toxin [Planctomycetota bacterium]
MEIHFASRKVQKLCNSEREMRAKLGPRNAKLLGRRLAELKAAVTLEDIRRVPPARCHELGQDRKGQLAVDLVHPKRLTFKPDHTPIPRKKDGGLDWSQVTAIVIVEVVDYH